MIQKVTLNYIKRALTFNILNYFKIAGKWIN